MSEAGRKRNRDKPRTRPSPTKNTVLVTRGEVAGAVGGQDGDEGAHLRDAPGAGRAASLRGASEMNTTPYVSSWELKQKLKGIGNKVTGKADSSRGIIRSVSQRKELANCQ